MVALVGPTGVGKTTITQLISRFYEPTAGRILVDGQDIRNITVESPVSYTHLDVYKRQIRISTKKFCSMLPIMLFEKKWFIAIPLLAIRLPLISPETPDEKHCPRVRI